MSGEASIDRVLALAAVPGLTDLHPDDLASLAERAEERRIAAGELAVPNDAREAVFLLAGALGCDASPRPFAAPAPVGVVEALEGVELPLRALGDGAHLLAVPREPLRRVIGDIFELWLAVMRHTAERLLAVEPREIEAVELEHRLQLGDSEVPLTTRIHLLAGCELLHGQRAYALGRLAAEMEELELRAGATLWEPGANPDAAFLLVDGRVAIPARDDGAAAEHGPGAMLGLRELLAAAPHEGRVEVATDARVLRLPRETLIDELEDDPDMAAALLDGLARRTLRAESAANVRAR